jgi:hypothetical protein
MLSIIIKLRGNLQYKYNKIKGIIGLIWEVKLKEFADVGDDGLDEIKLDHPGDEDLVNLVLGDGLPVEVVPVNRVVGVPVVGKLDLLHAAH